MPRCLMDAAVNHYFLPSASGDFPQVAEFNTPRSMVAAGECSAYDGFKACKIHSAAPVHQRSSPADKSMKKVKLIMR